jgi:hypothetical protein
MLAPNTAMCMAVHHLSCSRERMASRQAQQHKKEMMETLHAMRLKLGQIIHGASDFVSHVLSLLKMKDASSIYKVKQRICYGLYIEAGMHIF